jgi:hypothetical protein
VSRRLLALATVALALLLSAGCADDVAPAARVGDLRITDDEILDEVEEWAGSPALLQAVQFPSELAEGGGTGTYSTALVDFVLGSRVSFEVHNTEFDGRGLDLTDDLRDSVREELFGPQTPVILDELSADYVDRLVDDVARRIALQEELGDQDYDDWLQEAMQDVEVSPRYGTWDAESLQILAPTDPAAPTTTAPAA